MGRKYHVLSEGRGKKAKRISLKMLGGSAFPLGEVPQHLSK